MIKKPHSALQYLKAITVYCFYATPKMPIQYTLKDLETKITIRNHQLTAKVSCWMSNVKFLPKSKIHGNWSASFAKLAYLLMLSESKQVHHSQLEFQHFQSFLRWKSWMRQPGLFPTYLNNNDPAFSTPYFGLFL